jgi:hypothetical protein
VLGALWGDTVNQHQVVDIFGFPPTGVWPGNPGVYPLVARRGLGEEVQIGKENEVTCTEGWIIAGGDLLRRRDTKSLREYMDPDRPLPQTGLFAGMTYKVRL